MTSGRVLIHVGGSNMPVEITLIEHIHQILRSLHHKSGEIFHIHSSVLVFQLKLFLAVFEEKITNLLIVDFEIGCAD